MSDSTFFQPALPTPNSDDSRPLPEIIADHFGFPLAYHDVEGVRYYAVQDWILGVAQPASHPGTFWTEMKRRLERLNINIAPMCKKLPYLAENNKRYSMDHGTHDLMMLIVQFMSKQSLSIGGFVYLLHFAEIPHLYKIGHTDNVQKRCGSIVSQTPFEGVVDHVIPCKNRFEAELTLHKIYKPNHYRNEWFELTPDQVNLFKTLKCDADILDFASRSGVKWVHSKKSNLGRRSGVRFDLATNLPLLKDGDR